MREFTESFLTLYHGTDEEAAKKILCEGFILSRPENSWCGAGVYFYDIKAKAWWSANRTCADKRNRTKNKYKPAVIYAEVKNIPKSEIFDLRVYRDLVDFETYVKQLDGYDLNCEGMDDQELVIRMRSWLIEFYAKTNNKRMVIGIFRQRPQADYAEAIEFANGLDIIFGVETIYCVKDASIITIIGTGGQDDEVVS
ncbi:MAG: hypothetical protein IJI26_05530 [Clostridia bacterium]|nr:hypothetical protein [Clostridia bacterium]